MRVWLCGYTERLEKSNRGAISGLQAVKHWSAWRSDLSSPPISHDKSRWQWKHAIRLFNSVRVRTGLELGISEEPQFGMTEPKCVRWAPRLARQPLPYQDNTSLSTLRRL